MTDFLKLLMIRHAQSTGNVEKRMQGQGEYELTPHGQAQTHKLAQRLIREQYKPTAIYTSPLRRTMQTTEILLSAFPTQHTPGVVADLTDVDRPLDSWVNQPIPIHQAPELAEFQNGIFQGLTWNEAQAQYPELCQKLESNLDWIAIPEAETLQDARDRVTQLLDRILTTHRNGEQVWLVSHSWIMQHLISRLLGCDRSWRMRIHNTALFEFWVDQSRWHRRDENCFNTDLWQIVRFNDTQHLNWHPNPTKNSSMDP
jgi:2,3-bisphosphoglycerate-dependent phosphoglycerate mutase